MGDGEGERMTPKEFPDAVRDAVGAVRAVSYPERQGWTSRVAVVVTERGAFAVKRSRGARWRAMLRRERAMLAALAGTGVPAPRAYVYCETETRVDENGNEAEVGVGVESWLVMDARQGVPIRRALAEERDAGRREWLLRAFGRTLAAIHATPAPEALTSGDGRDWLGGMLEQAGHNLGRYETHGTAALLERLRRERPEPVTPTLIHGDFTIDNTLVEEGRVTGVIDWAAGTVGDPRYDVALAIRPKREAFQTGADLRAFFAGYAERRRPMLTAKEYTYFVDLYEFF